MQASQAQRSPRSPGQPGRCRRVFVLQKERGYHASLPLNMISLTQLVLLAAQDDKVAGYAKWISRDINNYVGIIEQTVSHMLLNTSPFYTKSIQW